MIAAVDEAEHRRDGIELAELAAKKYAPAGDRLGEQADHQHALGAETVAGQPEDDAAPRPASPSTL